MFLETFVSKLFTDKYKQYKSQKEGYTDDNGDHKKVTVGVMIVYAIFVVITFVFWILAIVSASKCPKPNVAEIILAIFCWPLYFIFKWTGVMCKDK